MKLNRQALRGGVDGFLWRGPVWRILAHGVVGKPKEAAEGGGCVAFGRSLRVLPTWRAGVSPISWFWHHTLLAVRIVADPSPPIRKQDLLVVAAAGQSREYLAFIGLAFQEDFRSSSGRRSFFSMARIWMSGNLVSRWIARRLPRPIIFRAATGALDAVTGGKAAELARKLSAAYVKLEPLDKTVVP